MQRRARANVVKMKFVEKPFRDDGAIISFRFRQPLKHRLFGCRLGFFNIPGHEV